jgi:hypothetical protein
MYLPYTDAGVSQAQGDMKKSRNADRQLVSSTITERNRVDVTFELARLLLRIVAL